MTISLADTLARGSIVLLDGGMGTELERRGVPMDPLVWSALAAKTHAGVLREVHEDYIRAGAQVIIANTFSTARHMLEAAGLGEETALLNRRSVEIAREARERVAQEPVGVAGSVSTMAPGEDRTLLPPLRQRGANHREQAELLAEAGCDLIVLEMMMDVDDAPLAAAAAARTGLPVWVGFSCRSLPDGEIRMWLNNSRDPAKDPPFDEVIPLVLEAGAQVAGLMHTDVSDMMPALSVLKKHWQGPLMAYAETGAFAMPCWDFAKSLSLEAYAMRALEWIAAGVQVVGGCCGTGPQHIRALKAHLPRSVPAR